MLLACEYAGAIGFECQIIGEFGENVGNRCCEGMGTATRNSTQWCC